MGRPGKSIVYAANATALGDLAAPTRQAGTKMLEAAGKARNAVYDLDWKGQTQHASEGRADRELAQDRRVADGYEALAKAYENGKNTMQPMIDSLKSQGKGFEGDGFEVAEDWKVTDKYNYDLGKTVLMLLGESEKDAQAAMDELKKKRGDEAATGTTTLQKLADELGTADTNTTNAINAAKSAIGASAPPEAGLAGGQQAADDARAVLAGTATPQQQARVRAALTKWTPEQLAALAQGKPADMPQGQYDYLKSFMGSMNNTSVPNIDKALGKYGLQGAMGDGMRMMATPNIRTALGDHGSIENVPKTVQGLLNGRLWKPFSSPGSGVQMIPINGFNALNDMLGKGNQNLRLGSDVDRALISQSSKVAALMNQGHAVATDDPIPPGGKASYATTSDTHRLNSMLDAMVTNASGDHQAVTDFLKGAQDSHSGEATRMVQATQGHFGDGNQQFVDLITHKFDDGQHGVRDVFDWIGANAHNPGFEGLEAARSANAYAHLLASNHELLGEHMPGSTHAGNQTLGQVNPELVQTMTKNLIPFMANLDGVNVPGIHADGIPGFGNTNDFANLIKVLDTDPASALAVNRAAAGWENYFAHEYGITGDPELARAAGHMTQAIQNGNAAELEALRANHKWDDIKAFNEKGAQWDTAKAILNTGLGFAGPLGPYLSKGFDIMNPEMKLNGLGIAGDPSKMSDNQWEAAVKQTQTDFANMVDGTYKEYSMTSGYLQAHPDVISQFQNVTLPNGQTVNFVDQNGNPNWNAIVKDHGEFSRRFNSLPLHDWDSSENGYDSGLRDTNIDPTLLPAPGDVARPPR